MFKYILISTIILLNSFNCFSDYLVLKDGNIIKGELEYLNKKQISLNLNYKLFTFENKDINYLLTNGYKSEKYINLILDIKKKINENAIFVKLTSDAIYYYLPTSDLLKVSEIKKITKLEYISKTSDNYSVEQYMIKKNSDILSEFNELLNMIDNKKDENTNEKKLNDNVHSYDYYFIDIEANDFYEKYWANINKYINNNTKNLIWNLFEIYSEKEKQLNIIFNEEILNSKSEEFVDKKIDELKNKIIQLRKNFFFRSKKIIYNSEFLTNTINNFK